MMSARSSNHDLSDRLAGGGPLVSDGVSMSHRRSGSSPPRSVYNKGLKQPVSQSTSPTVYPFSSMNSPRMTGQYSPVATSPSTASMVRELPPFEQHPSAGYGNYDHNIPPPPALQSYSSTSSTPPSLGGFGSQYPNTRDLPTRRSTRETSSLPSLTREDTTVSSGTMSSSASHGSARPESHLAGVDPSKSQRTLPQPVPMLNPQHSPFDQRPYQISPNPGLPKHGSDIRSGSASLAALLRAGELVRDADNTQMENDRPP